MGQISIKIQNRTYRLSCDDGEEQRLTELAGHVRDKADQLIAEYGRIGDEHLMLMSAILIADELWDERAGEAAPSKTGPPEHAGDPDAHEKTPETAV
ncbi:MAG: cell division protein ZapA [Hyphomicrobiaceae bacterium]